MSIRLRPALEFDLSFLADVFNRGFEGYFVTVAESPEALAARLRYDTIDLALSQVALDDDRAVGIVYVSVRGWQCRIAGMGVAVEARRRGVGRRLMEAVITHCREVGFGRIVLEVIEQNDPAVALYRSLGFETLRRLVGYELAETFPELTEQGRRDAAALASVDPREVGRQIARETDPDLPWQLAPQTFGARGPELSGAQLHGKAFALFSEPASGSIALEALLVPRADRRSGWGSRLVRALASRHKGRAWSIPARVPEDLAAPFFSRLGFRGTSITQLEMDLPL